LCNRHPSLESSVLVFGEIAMLKSPQKASSTKGLLSGDKMKGESDA
jgi:hypothetical protein